MMSVDDESVLQAIRSAVKAAAKKYGGIRDANDSTVKALVLKHMPHIDFEWLSSRIRVFQAIVNDHVVKSAIHIII